MEKSYHIPPWEIRQLQQVPFNGQTAAAKRSDLPEFDAGNRELSQSVSRESFRRPSLRPTDSGRSDKEAWRRHPSASSNTSPYETPYQTPAYIDMPPAPLTTQELPTYDRRVSPNPPRNDFSVAPPGVGYRSPPANIADIKAMPGTMSARTSRDQGRTKGRADTRSSRRQGSLNKESGPKFGAKFKSAMKDLFHKSPVDESDFEQIRTRHWTEDEY